MCLTYVQDITGLEWIFGATDYEYGNRCMVKWLCHGGTVGWPAAFPGESGVDQLVEIIKALGTPTRQQIKSMNPNYSNLNFLTSRKSVG